MSQNIVVRLFIACDGEQCMNNDEYCSVQEAREDGWSVADDHEPPHDTSDYCPECGAPS